MAENWHRCQCHPVAIAWGVGLQEGRGGCCWRGWTWVGRGDHGGITNTVFEMMVVGESE